MSFIIDPGFSHSERSSLNEEGVKRKDKTVVHWRAANGVSRYVKPAMNILLGVGAATMVGAMFFQMGAGASITANICLYGGAAAVSVFLIANIVNWVKEHQAMKDVKKAKDTFDDSKKNLGIHQQRARTLAGYKWQIVYENEKKVIITDRKPELENQPLISRFSKDKMEDVTLRWNTNKLSAKASFYITISVVALAVIMMAISQSSAGAHLDPKMMMLVPVGVGAGIYVALKGIDLIRQRSAKKALQADESTKAALLVGRTTQGLQQRDDQVKINGKKYYVIYDNEEIILQETKPAVKK